LVEGLGLERNGCGALTLPASGVLQVEDARFFETVCVNRGWEVKLPKKASGGGGLVDLVLQAAQASANPGNASLVGVAIRKVAGKAG
jgi:hypothetical protein